ncbi:MAG: S8 family serine peptidase [Candidatus Zixiibacteriota bacterium]
MVYQNLPDNTVAVVVAIIDTGVDTGHPDIVDNIWSNPREIAGNGIDDDNNGFIDDIRGWDFGGDGSSTTTGDNNPMDGDGHGTHIAGIVAATADNNIGVAGLARNCRIMPLKIFPLPLTSFIVGAIVYAADNGADVINMSFGLPYASQLMEEAMAYARAKGVVLCAAAGNDFTEFVNYPASSPLTIAVGATDDSDHVASFSTYGNHLDICAPGHSILSLRAGNTDMYADSYPREPNVHIINTRYYLASGTSMACPYVVATAAYLRAVSPGLSPQRVQEILQSSADDILDPYGVNWYLPGWDKFSGYGRVNLYQTLQAAPEIRARITSPLPNEILSGTVDIAGIADGSSFTEYTLEYGQGGNPPNWTVINTSSSPVSSGLLGSWDTAGLNGRYTIRLQAGSDHQSLVSVYLINESSLYLSSPLPDDSLSGSVDIIGSAYCPEFSRLVIEYDLIDSAVNWDTIAVRTVPLFDDFLARWFIDDLPAGDYDLKLTLYSRSGFAGYYQLPVHIGSIFATERAWKIGLGQFPGIIPNYGDFDDDGLNEVVVGGSDGIRFFNLDGTAKTDGAPAVPQNNFTTPVAVGNLDNDGVDDFVAVGYDPPIVYGYPSSEPDFRNYLGVLPSLGSNLVTEAELPRVFLKDLNSDSRDEIHIVLPDYQKSKVFILSSEGQFIRTYDYTSGYHPVDLDGDGVDELYLGHEDFGLIRQVEPLTGVIQDSLIITEGGSTFYTVDISSYDIDNDKEPELLIYGYYRDLGYWLYAFEYGFLPVAGWPRQLNINDFVVPTNPVFGDINGDQIPEYFATYFDFSASYILAWNLDGSSFIPGNADGYFATVPELSVLNMLLLADMNGDSRAEIVACAINDVLFDYRVQRIYAWNQAGEIISGFPIVAEAGNSTYYRHTPVIGDINKNGDVDLVMTTADSSLIFVEFPGAEFSPCTSPAPFWRYDRDMSNMGGIPDSCGPTDISENETLLPSGFSLSQNRPNPFNSSTALTFTLPRKEHLALTIYDILGRPVRTLLDRPLSAGRYEVRWDGLTDKGQPTASGVYLYRIKTSSFAVTRKMVLMK